MAGTLVFVHGTGVRGQGYVTTLGRVRDGISVAGLSGVTTVGVPWGDELGIRIDGIAATLPPEITTRAASGEPAVSEADLEAETWAMLVEDPLVELRMAGNEAPGDGGFAIGELAPDQQMEERLAGLGARLAAIAPNLEGMGISHEELASAAAEIAKSAELGAAARAAGSPNDDGLARLSARAVVAQVLFRHRLDPRGSEPVLATDMAMREDLVGRLADLMLPAGTRTVGDLFRRTGAKIKELALGRVTNALIEHREGLLGRSLPKLGDILFYQRRGEKIRDRVAAALRAATDRPVVALGHSLGGIVLVDLLSGGDAPTVDLLVTAGSQSPLLYAIDALGSLRPGQGTPRPFVPWLNLYSHRDFLSFLAREAFSGIAGIEDVEVDTSVPFPESHSAYWTAARTYELIRDRWPG